MLVKSTNWLVALSLVISASCTLGGGPGDGSGSGSGTGTDGTVPPPPDHPLPPPVIVYKRGSLKPTYQLTPEDRLQRFNEQGVTLQDSDFTINNGAGFTSASQKMEQISGQIARDNSTANIPIIDGVDRTRADKIPFRGNPSAVKIVHVNGRREAWVPLGGDLMTPGNEVVAMDITNPAAVTRTQIMQVGVRPQRLVAHPAQTAGSTQLIFVCNQFSNYITVIDAVQHRVLVNANNQPVEVKTEFYCTDLLFAPQTATAPDPDKQDLYVANSYRGSVLKYGITLVRSGVGNAIADITVAPVVELTGVGANPNRLTLGQDLRTLFVANSRGGELARVDLISKSARKIAFNGPAIDVAQAFDFLIVPTTSVDRGLPARDDQMPSQQFSPPVRVTGLDGTQQIAHPGSQTDNTKAYNFEDLRNGMLTVDAQLTSGSSQYLTDDISPERNFDVAQKIVQGSIPLAITLNAGRTRAFVAMSGSDVIQEFAIGNGAFRLTAAKSPAQLMHTKQRPFALAFDDAANEVVAVTWGGESLDIFDAGTGTRKSSTDLGYGTVPYPATNMEKGEYLFYNTTWSNNGRKSCGQCHLDELLLDGIPYANGATAASAYHKVPANFNLMTTDNYFWNGSFANGTYASLASDAQSRSNCELILFGLIEGISSNPATRVGDPNHNIGSLGAAVDQQCRPDLSTLVDGVLPANFDAVIAPIIDQEKAQRDAKIKQITAGLGLGSLGFKDVSRFVDWYDVSELRLPPNAMQFLIDTQQLDPVVNAKVETGKGLFTSQGCANCHQPGNALHPFTDGLNHGQGSSWVGDFIDKYANDPRVAKILNKVGIQGLPANLLQARKSLANDKEINVHANIDFFIPFCFDGTHCLEFDDPMGAAPQSQLETDRLNVLVKINLANLDRGFFPGSVVGKPTVNTPALRGLWMQTNYLRHGLARSLNETILAPGHPALRDGEKGFAMDRFANKDVHGNTSSLSADQVDALFLYLNTL
jgi:hypothetical protein